MRWVVLLLIACTTIKNNFVFEKGPSGAVRYDYDGDGFAGPWVCPADTKGCDAASLNAQPLANLDCNDHDANVHPGAPDTPGDGIDSNCDGADGVVSKTVPERLLPAN
jgi:hypothetical protein